MVSHPSPRRPGSPGHRVFSCLSLEGLSLWPKWGTARGGRPARRGLGRVLVNTYGGVRDVADTIQYYVYICVEHACQYGPDLLACICSSRSGHCIPHTMAVHLWGHDLLRVIRILPSSPWLGLAKSSGHGVGGLLWPGDGGKALPAHLKPSPPGGSQVHGSRCLHGHQWLRGCHGQLEGYIYKYGVRHGVWTTGARGWMRSCLTSRTRTRTSLLVPLAAQRRPICRCHSDHRVGPQP